MNKKEHWPEGVFEMKMALTKLEEPTVDEKNLEPLGIENPKTRLNYLHTLGVIAKPMPKYFGKKQGGTRLLQGDIVEILEFIDEQKQRPQPYALNDIAEIIRDRRHDLVGKACKELGIERGETDFLKMVHAEADLKCPFEYPLIKAMVLSTWMTVTQAAFVDLYEELGVLERMYAEVGKGLNQGSRKVIKDFIRRDK